MKIVLAEIENFKKSVEESVSLGTKMEFIIPQYHCSLILKTQIKFIKLMELLKSSAHSDFR